MLATVCVLIVLVGLFACFILNLLTLRWRGWFRLRLLAFSAVFAAAVVVIPWI